jgi:CHAT domain-containing protein
MAGRKPAEKSVAVFADPVFGAEDAAVRKIGVRDAHRSASAETGTPRAQAEGLKLGRLPSTRREAEAIISAVPPGTGMMATDFAANRARVISGELAKYRVVHFATHGYPDDRHPNLSWIALSTVDDTGRSQDGFLRLLDIYNLDLPADLVVLSACQTALGKNVRGEGLIGLVRGFMYAGAARVVASLWKVDDESTAELMRAFYRAMFQGGKPAAAALRQAQVELSQTKRWSAPYHWAAFVLQGEWK